MAHRRAPLVRQPRPVCDELVLDLLGSSLAGRHGLQEPRYARDFHHRAPARLVTAPVPELSRTEEPENQLLDHDSSDLDSLAVHRATLGGQGLRCGGRVPTPTRSRRRVVTELSVLSCIRTVNVRYGEESR